MAPGTAILAILALTQLPASPDPKPVPIAGVVVDATGRPVAGAEVWLAEAVPPAEGASRGTGIARRRSPRGRSRGKLRRWPTRGPTPAGGSPSRSPPRSSRGRRRRLWSSGPPPWARGRACAWYRLPGVVLADDPPVRITLGASARSQVRIIDPDRKPVAGAGVFPTRADGSLVPGPLGQALAATSDANGGATIAGLSPGVLDEVRVSAADWGEQILEVPDSPFKISDSKRRLMKVIKLALHAGRADPGATGVAARRADPGRDDPRHVAGRRICRLGAGGCGSRRVRRAGAIRDPGHRRGDDDPGAGVRPRAGHDVPQLAAEPDPGPRGPDDRGDDPDAAHREGPGHGAREGERTADRRRRGDLERISSKATPSRSPMPRGRSAASSLARRPSPCPS